MSLKRKLIMFATAALIATLGLVVLPVLPNRSYGPFHELNPFEIGLMVVLQNVFSSLFNSHLFDFHEGWMYVLGVGVAGGAVPHRSHRVPPPAARRWLRQTG